MPEEKRILVVDDDQNILKIIEKYLTLKGYSVDTAKTGKEAIEKSKNRFYNLTILDIRLPDMQGTELLTAMRDTEPRTMKIMLTGYPGYENAVKSLNKGADAYLVKPLQLEELLKVVDQKLKEQEQELKMDQDNIIKYLESRSKELDEKHGRTK